METIIFVFGVVIMIMVIGGIFMSMMLSFASAAKKDE